MSVPCVPSVPPSISFKTIKEIDRNGPRNAPERRSWYVAQVAAKMEMQAVELLDGQGVPAYCPVETHLSRHSQARRRKRYMIPLLPRYLFVRLPVEGDGAVGGMDAVRKALGSAFLGLVAVAGNPRPVADRWIEALSLAERAGAFDYQPRGRPNYAKGEQVRIMTGAMAGRIAEIVANKNGRLKLVLEPLDARGQVIDNARPLRVKVEPDAVEPANPTPAAPPETGLWPPAPDITP
ncbi:transcription termination/antitermination protein NusG [Caulobacter sp. BP25]|uniref:transcription termination/antitermination protein NusG n=1 Tax=Caulobacter sp. BP25 TaxID=2048900 RepID=UPI000C12D149|nr:transcription termination/antitermination NusG family protein [Caulobacter sp. BP25]PHY20917.1 hypothetical protein CSW59_06820 [Caulobacter sp. BP25]